MERARFVKLSSTALEHIEDGLAALEHEDLDVDLAGDVLTLAFADGTKFIINAHSAAGQVWMAANRSAWHFDWVREREQWIAAKTGDELMSTVARTVGAKLGTDIEL
jgi:CyaY protein